MEYPKGKSNQKYSLRLTLNAVNDIDAITGYIAFVKHQPVNSIRVGNKIFEVIDRIGKNPLIFRECEEIRTAGKIYRKAVCMSWLIIYKVVDNNIIILGIIHGSRASRRISKLKT